jgi:hypothetical protein
MLGIIGQCNTRVLLFCVRFLVLVTALVNALFRLYYFGFKGRILAEKNTMGPVFGLFNSE